MLLAQEQKDVPGSGANCLDLSSDCTPAKWLVIHFDGHFCHLVFERCHGRVYDLCVGMFFLRIVASKAAVAAFLMAFGSVIGGRPGCAGVEQHWCL